MSDKLQYLFLLPQKFGKGISQIKRHSVLLITLYSFGATQIQINALSGSGSEKRNQCGSGKMQWIRIRNAVQSPTSYPG